jgi:hypothetical protein
VPTSMFSLFHSPCSAFVSAVRPELPDLFAQNASALGTEMRNSLSGGKTIKFFSDKVTGSCFKVAHDGTRSGRPATNIVSQAHRGSTVSVTGIYCSGGQQSPAHREFLTVNRTKWDRG